MKILLTTFILLFCPIAFCNAEIVTIMTSTPVLSDTFTDGSGDYFGIVAGGQIGGSNFSSSINPPDGSVAGEDLDGEGGTGTETATWNLALPGDAVLGTGLTSIDFSGLLAAADTVWDNSDGIDIQFLVNGTEVGLNEYRYDRANGDNFNETLALDTDGDGIGDGAAVPAAGIALSFTDVGGASITSASVVMTFFTNGGSEEFWANGTLSADYDRFTAVPEPTTFAMFGIALCGLGFRRRK